MEFSKGFKITWWIVTEIIIAVLIYIRRSNLMQNEPSQYDLTLLILFVGLLMMPIFSELEVFGFKLKNEISNVKKDVEVLDKKLTNIVTLQNTSHQTLNLNQPVSDDRLPEIEKEIKKISEQLVGVNKSDGGNVTQRIHEVSDDVTYLFSVRYNIEKYVRQIAEKSGILENESRGMPVTRILMKLSAMDKMDTKFLKSISDVYRICSPAVHGEDVDSEKLDFVKSIDNDIFRYLDAILDFM